MVQVVWELLPELRAGACFRVVWVLSTARLPPIVDDVFHGSVFCEHRPRGGYEERGDQVLVLVDGLFEESPQIGSVVRVHQRLHKDGFAGLWGLQAPLPKDDLQRFLRGLLVDIGQVACHTAQSIYARGAGFASQQRPNALESPSCVGAKIAQERPGADL